MNVRSLNRLWIKARLPLEKILITHALKEEQVTVHTQGCSIDTLYTGIGKTRSAMSLTKYICTDRPDMVLNVGTAGTFIHRIGEIIVASHFIDRDFEKDNLPGVDFEIEGTALWKVNKEINTYLLNHFKTGICSTGDTFVTQTVNFRGDVVDMEAFAQAYVCKTFDIPFFSIKYVTDVIGQNSVAHWESQLSDARTRLSAWFETEKILEFVLNRF